MLAEALCRDTKMLIVLARHGARYSYGNLESHTKEMKITQNGLRMGYVLGRYLRATFPDFFPSKFYYRHNYLISSTPARCQATAQAIMVGIYGENTLDSKIEVDERFFRPNWKGTKRVKVDFDTALPKGYQPFPIHAATSTENTMLNPFDGHVCPKIYFREIKKSDQYTTQLLSEINDLLPKLKTSKFNPADINKKEQLTNFDEFDAVADYVMTRKYMGDDLGIGEAVYQEMDRLHTAQTWNTYFARPELSKYLMTELLRFMIKLLRETEEGLKNGKQYVRFALFAAHDLNIMNYLILTDNFKVRCLKDEFKEKDDCPPIPLFASSVVWELFKEGEQLFVEAKFNGQMIKICGEKLRCSLNDFQLALKSITLDGEMDSLLELYCDDFVSTKNSHLKWILYANIAAIIGLGLAVWYLKRKLTSS